MCNTWLSKLALSGLAFFFLEGASAEYAWSTPSTRTTVTVNVVWLKTQKEVDLVCSIIGNTKPKGTILGCYVEQTTTIYAVEPKDFDDSWGLHILGHEFWHALGAKHPR